MRRTLLEMVQEILNDMSSDEVNSVDDTVESQQVANIIKSCYLEMMSNRDWPHMKRFTVLDSVIDVNRPTHLKLPEDVKELIFLNYDITKSTDTRINYRELKYKYPDEFIRYTMTRNSSDANTVRIVDTSGAVYFILNNIAPTYWTSFDDQYIVCDAYDNLVDTTLQSSKTQMYCVKSPTWEGLDDSVPDLPAEAFSALIEEAKSTSFLVLKQSANQKAEQKVRRQQQWLSRKAWQAHGGVRYQNWGRRSKK